MDATKAAMTENTDITWLQLLGWFIVAATINGAVRSMYAGIAEPIGEQVVFYLGSALSYFLIPAAIIIPLHFLGKKMSTGFQAPRKLVLCWGFLLTGLLLVAFLLKR